MQIFFFVLTATILEAVGDAVIRIALHHPSQYLRVAFFFLGAALLTGYGTSLNLAPVEFATVRRFSDHELRRLPDRPHTFGSGRRHVDRLRRAGRRSLAIVSRMHSSGGSYAYTE